MTGLSITPEHAAALKEYGLLLAEVPRAEEEKDHLLYHTVPLLTALYLKLVGERKVELLKVQTELFALKRTAEMMQATLNRGGAIMMEVINALVEAEVKEQKTRIEKEVKRVEEAMKVVAAPTYTEEESNEIKTLYHKLARRLHPDLNPEVSEEQRALWIQVAEAYKEGRLDRLRVLSLISDQSADGEPAAPSTLEELQRKIKFLKSAMENTLKHISKIKAEFPFNVKEHLDDQNWIKEENERTELAIQIASRQKEEYQRIIDLLLKESAT